MIHTFYMLVQTTFIIYSFHILLEFFPSLVTPCFPYLYFFHLQAHHIQHVAADWKSYFHCLHLSPPQHHRRISILFRCLGIVWLNEMKKYLHKYISSESMQSEEDVAALQLNLLVSETRWLLFPVKMREESFKFHGYSALLLTRRSMLNVLHNPPPTRTLHDILISPNCLVSTDSHPMFYKIFPKLKFLNMKNIYRTQKEGNKCSRKPIERHMLSCF